MDDNQVATGNSPVPVPYSIFTPRQKTLIVCIVSLAATFSGFSANIYYPSIPAIAADFSVTPELVNLTVTSYMILQGLSPSFWGSFADVYGRRIIYICTFIVYVAANIGLANIQQYSELVVLRCLQSAGSASTIALGAGVVGDITTRAERGGYIGYFQAGQLVPTAIGPVIGGAISDTLGWRSIFWFLAIYSGVFLLFLILVLPETLRSLVGNGSVPAKGVRLSLLSYIQRRRHQRSSVHSNISLAGTKSEVPAEVVATPVPTLVTNKKPKLDLIGPLKIIFRIEVIFLILLLSIHYTGWMMVVSVMPTLFRKIYGLSEMKIGLTYIANGLGCILGTLLTGQILDIEYRRVQKNYHGSPENFPLENARFRTLWLWCVIDSCFCLIFGWTLWKGVHIAVPICCTFFIGWASISVQGVVTTYMVDIFPDRSASATAALNLSRCLIGAGGTAAALPLVNAVNVGWTFTMLMGILLASIGLIPVSMFFGSRKSRKRSI